MTPRFIAIFFIFLITANKAFCSTPNDTALAVWVNEALTATYSYDYADFITQQKRIARYFTADAWLTYNHALQKAGLPQSVQKHAYYVSAVAQLPPTVRSTGVNQWEAIMPLLVVYKNPQYQQKQILRLTVAFKAVPEPQGIRGLAITGLRSTVIEPPCVCSPVGHVE